MLIVCEMCRNRLPLLHNRVKSFMKSHSYFHAPVFNKMIL